MARNQMVVSALFDPDCGLLLTTGHWPLATGFKNGGHFSFTDIFKINKNFGDGAGQGKRRASGEPFDFTSMEVTYKIINSYSVAFLGYYLKGQKDYLNFLTANH